MHQFRRSPRVSSSSPESGSVWSLVLYEDENLGRIRGRSRSIPSKVRQLITVKNVVNAGFILAICSVCFQQCFIQISEYFQYKTRIQVSHNFPKSTVFLLPGITICNNNRLRLDNLAEEFPSIKDDVAKVLNHTRTGMLNDRRRIELIRSIKQAVYESINISKIINESPISKLMRLSRLPMIKDINCNTSWGKKINCENIRIVESFQGVPCYTAFYLGSLIEAMNNGKAYDFKTSALNGKTKTTAFDSHEIAELLLDFDPLQHGDFNRDVGGKIVIHSTGHVGSVRDVAHSILPGMKYEIIIQRFMSTRLPPPYESMCFNYKQHNSHKFVSEGATMLPSIELDKTTCTRNCIIRQATKTCNCWPVEVPHYANDNIVNNSDSYRLCAWGYEEASVASNSSTKLYVDCYRKFHAQCRASCRHGCRTEDYRVYKLTNPWPGRDKFLLAGSVKEKMELSRLRGCCAVISIKYIDLMERRHIMIPNLTLAQLVSNIGGIVSALVGVSTVTIYRYITRRVLNCKIINDYNPNDSNNLASPMISLGHQKHQLKSPIQRRRPFITG